MVPGAMFSIVTSAFLSSSRTISSPRGDFTFKVTDFLLALNWWKYHGSSGWPGCSRRPGSPVRGFSTFTTSAPSHARASVHEGPASNWVKSTTRMPSRQLSSTLMPIAHLSRCDDMPIIMLIIPAGATHRPYRGGGGVTPSLGLLAAQYAAQARGEAGVIKHRAVLPSKTPPKESLEIPVTPVFVA